MKILAFDPGSKRIGYAVIQGHAQAMRLIDFGTLDIPKETSEGLSLRILFEKAQELVQEHDPDEIAVEALYFSSNTTTAMAVAQARGVILLSAALNNIDIASYSPPEIKRAICGNGRAEKSQIQNAVKMILKLDKKPQDDAADAIALAICHYNLNRFRQKVKKAESI